MGIHKTYEKIRERYFWKGMYKDCEHWVRSCVDCFMKKTPENKQPAIMLPIPVATTDAATIARLLVDELHVCRHEAPRTLLSDRGKNFMSILIKEVCQILNIKKIQNSSTIHVLTV